MIDPHAITCFSELHDSCGVVFKHQGRIFRALYPRGERMFKLLIKDGWMDRLVSMGFVKMRRTDLTLPGYESVIEADTISPVVPPIKWSTGMLCEAGQVLCALSQEFLTRQLLLWDLKHFSNMAFCSKRGPVFLDLGAIHSIEEMEHKVFDISKGSLLDQIARSFYVPLWLTLGSPAKFSAAKRFVAYRRRGTEAFDLPAAILRRISSGWTAIPGLGKGARLLKAGRYQEFFRLVAERLRTWSESLSAQVVIPPEWNGRTGSTGAEHARVIGIIEQAVGGLSNKTCFGLGIDRLCGLRIAEETNSATYILTSEESEADALFAWRQKSKKPALPVVCDIWDRSLKTAFALRESADVAFILPDLFQAASARRVPLDFIGQVLSLLTKDVAVVGIGSSTASTFPSFLSPPSMSGNPVEFATKTIGKYFSKQELIQPSGSHEGSVLVVFRK
jgi:hypothetical protein